MMVTTDYAYVAVAVMGAGMGLTLAPASESILNVLPAEQAGVGSAVNDTVQELGARPALAWLAASSPPSSGQGLGRTLLDTAAARASSPALRH
jgi:hypothetical protein